MKYKISKKRLLILVSLMIVEVVSISLAIRSYGNRYQNIDKVMFINDNGEYLEVESSNGWPKGNYEMNEMSKCIESDGSTHINKPIYSNTNNTVVMTFDKSIDCYLYFNNIK